MKKILYIESSPRKNRSHSINVTKKYLEKLKSSNEVDIKKIDLWDYELPEFDGDLLNAKYTAISGTESTPEEDNAWAKVIDIFNEFQDADQYIFSVPMWNFSIPYKLKHYIDIVTQPGLSWSYSQENGYSGLMTGKEATIIYASGDGYGDGTGFESYDFQKPYMNLWLTFIGFEKIESLIADRTLFEPEESELRALKG
jgi:FMN-dependent NADH-azoreductase|tara:strand:- start:10734 stop:11327 length:594 start_codon:yes stop_codon:yes gene_type:complete